MQIMRSVILSNLVLLLAVTVARSAPSQVREVPFPYRTIQEAINDAGDGDTVVVHPGTYTGDGNRDVDFSGKAITVRSEDPEEEGIVAATIIDCQGTPEDPHRAFIFQTGEDANSVLDGFTIINGYIRIDGADADVPDSNGADGEDAYGGAINCTGSNPIIRNCIINSCIAEGGWGGNGADGDPGDPNDPNDPSSSGTNGGDAGSGYGGAIYSDPNSAPTIINCQINQCSALAGSGGEGGAGGIGSSDGEPGSSDANGFGGGIYIDTGGTVTMSGCIINACTSVSGGAVYCGANCALTISESSITEAVSDYGAGIYCDANCVLVMDGCNLTNCSAQSGAGIYNDANCVFTISNTNILDNTAAADGGGILFGPAGAMTLTNCDISRNVSTGSGGGIYYDTGGALTLTACNLTSNSSGDGIGGGIFAGDLDAELGVTIIISKCDIIDNTALYGAGMCLLAATCDITDSSINSNAAEYGGGAYWCCSDVNVTNCTIADNVAATRTYCSGGGFYGLDSSVRIKDCVMTGNHAQGFGGAVYLIGPNLPGGSHELTNCLITHNLVGLDGAGLSFNVDAAPVITNCTVAYNIVTDPDGSGGGISCYDASARIENTILWRNTAENGRELAIGDPLELLNPPAVVDLIYSDVRGGEEDVFVGLGCTLNWGEGNIDADPLFAQGYHLSQIDSGELIDSPCMDAGSDSAETFGLYRATTRTDRAPDSNTVDTGYHYKIPRILCDFDFDTDTDLADMAVLMSYWLEQNCELRDDCQGSDMDDDNDVDFLDFVVCAAVYEPTDQTPPTPDPSQWLTLPNAPDELPGTIMMRVVQAHDPSGVEYRFVCTGGAGHDSGWQDHFVYLDNGLPPGTYTYKVQTRDKSPKKNRTNWSEEASATI